MTELFLCETKPSAGDMYSAAEAGEEAGVTGRLPTVEA